MDNNLRGDASNIEFQSLLQELTAGGQTEAQSFLAVCAYLSQLNQGVLVGVVRWGRQSAGVWQSRHADRPLLRRCLRHRILRD